MRIDAVKSLGILFMKAKQGRTFNFDTRKKSRRAVGMYENRCGQVFRDFICEAKTGQNF